MRPLPDPCTEATLAAELYAARLAGYHVTPYGAAKYAAEFVRLGRSYRRLSERLCNEPDEGGKVAKRRERVRERAEALLKEGAFRAEVEIMGDGLGLALITRHPYRLPKHGTNMQRERTALL
jgi:hypothetical protein